MTTAPTTTLPRRRQLLALGLGVVAVHLALLFSSGHDMWRLQAEAPPLRPLQTRVLSTENPARAKMTDAKSVAAPRPAALAPAPTKSSRSDAAKDVGMQALASSALPAPEPAPVQQAGAIPETGVASELAPPTSNSPTGQAISAPLNNPTLETTQQASSLAANSLVAKAGNFPDNTQINYKLTGQERGLNYHASGALKWQVKSGSALPKAYEAELSVKAFLMGSRVWRSTGLLTDVGLSPTRYSDTARSERAAHFETDAQKISFSGNLPSAPLLPGAQDQVSLFIQMAATVSAQSFKPGAELNVQTATARDAVNWTLTYKADEFIEVNGDRLETQRWVCLPRGKFDSQIEMWLAKAIGGLPARIKITQVSGNFIDMEMRGSEVLPALAD